MGLVLLGDRCSQGETAPYAEAPVGEIMTGIDDGCPMIVVSICRSAGWPAVTGRKPSSSNADVLSRMVTPASAPATMAPYDEVGSRFLARCWAMATVSNQGLAMSSSPNESAAEGIGALSRPPNRAAPGAKRRTTSPVGPVASTVKV